MKPKTKTLAAAFAIVLLFCGTAQLIHDANAAAADYGTPTVIDIAPGMKYTYKPTYTPGLAVTTTIEEQDGNWGTISSGTLNVNVPANATSGTTYDVVLKGTATNPDQTIYIPITLSIKSNATVSGSHPNIVIGSTVSMTPTVTGLGTFTWSVTADKTLPAGLSLDTITGKVTGTPTQTGTCTIYLTATSNHGESQDLVVTFQIAPALTVTNSPSAGAISYVIS